MITRSILANLYRSTVSYPLNTGAKIPAVGFGTFQATDEEAYSSVVAALKAGYRHIDTAWIYGNESQVGQAIKDSGVPREEIFVTTKVWGTFHQKPLENLEISLEKLGLEYVDLWLIHWPVPLNPNGNSPRMPTNPDGSRDVVPESEWDFVKTYELVQEAVALGKAKSVGVSNFSIKNLKKLLAAPTTKIVPAANQVELHPLLPQPELIEFCKQNNIVVEAYSPLGSTGSPVLKDETLIAIAKEYEVSPATIAISWAVWRNTVVLPKSVTASRIESNLEIVQLKDEDGERINEIAKKNGPKRLINPPWAPYVVFND
ncbi:unnamed protein product [Kuraishia capsulata CBS 1993]|uniref:2-dehydropantolactone reductase n=1 Tax=Kuraishia capsulata CBS 1993 TaxID=1382522 RepID=W6MWK4_9ASCO|nr:uncharacterized protein KUCA_T00003543001 [Kuraishia capsulata CBS 1993]CDK27565.1 unnamed protein product [Kuraishia capsulata CBS 1993]